MRRCLFVLTPGLLLGTLALYAHTQTSADRKNHAEARLRRPVALALVEASRTLLVANRDSGSVSLVDLDTLRVKSEVPVGRKVADLSVTGDRVLVADESSAEVLLLSFRDGVLQKTKALKTGMSPVAVRGTDDGTLAAVACLWPRRVELHSLQSNDRKVVDLPFAPRRLAFGGAGKLLVADAFGGHVAVVDVVAGKIDSMRELAVHNIRGLTLERGRKSLWLTHQTLNRQGHTTRGEIQTSNVVTNNVHRFSLTAFLDPVGDVLRDDRSYSLGDVELGAGDPAEVAEGLDDQLVVALAGVDEVALGRPEQVEWTRLKVGKRPTALAVDAARKRAYVANTFSDSISVIDLAGRKVLSEIALGPTVELGPAQRGELLFFDARLSFESWYSCQSCHPDGHTNGRLNDNFSDGSFGTPKRVLSLLGVKDTAPWAWNGQVTALQDQVRTSIKSTMQGLAPTDEQVRDLTAFLETLVPPPSLLQARGQVNKDAFERGQALFTRLKCVSCHKPPLYTSPRTYDVGLRDEAGASQFNPPSLRGVSQAGPYFHDNRAASLRDVLTRFNHQVHDKLSDTELDDLLHFLRGL